MLEARPMARGPARGRALSERIRSPQDRNLPAAQRDRQAVGGGGRRRLRVCGQPARLPRTQRLHGIRAVRASENPDAPIFVLTGELLTGKASESEISEVIRQFDVACYEKPARLAILVADLSKRLNRV